MNKTIFLLLVAAMLIAENIEIKISGMVTDQNDLPLAYANIYLEGCIEGATSDTEGYFEFKVQGLGNHTLICNYIGYKEFRKNITLREGQNIIPTIILCENPIEGNQVTVTASAFTSGNEEGVTLTPLEIVSTPGAAADIFWAIKTYPGVQQVDDGAGLFVRGGDVSETAVIIDGAYLKHPYRYESPNGGYFGTIPPFLLKGTYFSSGGYSAEYGNALSGALIMESQDIPMQNDYSIGISLAAISGSANLSILTDKLGLSFSGNYSDTRSMFELNHERYNFSRYPTAYDFNLNTMYKYSKNGSLKVFVFHEVDEVGIEVKNPSFGGFYEGDAVNTLINLQWKQLINSQIFITGNAAFNRFKNKQNLIILDLDTDDKLYQARLAMEYNLKDNFKLKTGVEAFENHVNLEGKVPYDENDFNPNASYYNLDLTYLSTRIIGFVETQWTLLSKFVITPGIRTEYESGSETQVIDPRISATYGLTENWNLTMAIGQYHQFPDPYYYDKNAGNPNLISMSALHYITGINYQKENTIYRIEAYYKDYDNLLLKDSDVNYTNKGYGHAYGIDLFAKRSYKEFNGWISYSLLDAKRKWMNLPNLSPVDFDITHNLNSILEINVNEHLKCGFAYRYATGKPYSSAGNLYNDSRVPSYQKLDMNLTYLYRFFEGNLSVFYLGISNLLGRDNIFDYYYSPDYSRRETIKSTMLRTVYFGLSFNF
jgi:vitamin B12 transporter